MSESTLQFRVGLFVIASAACLAALVVRFSELRSLWEPRYTIAVALPIAPGVQIGTPVRKNGIGIGKVREVLFDDDRGGVLLVLSLRPQYRLRADSRPRLELSLLGDAVVEFTPGRSPEFLKDGAKVAGDPPLNPLDLVDKLDGQVSATLDAFANTSKEWTEVAQRINGLMQTKEGHLEVVVERAAESLQEFTLAMRHANKVFGRPENQENMERVLSALPEMLDDTRGAIRAAHVAVDQAGQNLANLKAVTGPLAKHSEEIVVKLEGSARNLEILLAELSTVAQNVSKEDGSLHMLVSDPHLYRNLNRSAASLDTILKTLQPVMADFRILSDKLATHPELLGVAGAFKGGGGVKSPEPVRMPSRGMLPAPSPRSRAASVTAVERE